MPSEKHNTRTPVTRCTNYAAEPQSFYGRTNEFFAVTHNTANSVAMRASDEAIKRAQ